MRQLIIFIVLIINYSIAQAALEVQQVADNVYALEGETTQRSPANLGNNSTHGVIITNKGVILIDSGASYLGAKQLHEAIQTITDQPIKIVINSGGQDHRWLGNDYFQQLGARIISSAKTHQDQKVRTDYHLNRLGGLIHESLDGTVAFYSTETFDEKMKLTLGNVDLELYHFGPAHTVGDIVIWMPNTKTMFTGDVVFNDRMLGIGPAKNAQSWVDVFEKMAEFKPEHVVPGHGRVSDLAIATKNTQQYLKFLINKIGNILENDGDMLEASKINQSEFHFLSGHQDIAGKNAQWVFEQMEFDY
ncbi:MAG: MBL fold metallo-hydrolase [Candidatus Thioglobus sp.]|uniref:MBL fold metallo-hydrolase n=1 Tax=Candidatus Thioglobus sp. TaxID=2026721 RepID=UPI00260AB59F|nr:MBL fold metallo-hydrolase [Candidatus Thioglobus sp.]MDC9727443.1 MBL fold metallo-hydrolase [Candidatus Thioglobus sp.]